MSTFVNTDPTAFKGVWVFCEQREGKLMPTDFELISEGRKLADDLGVELCGLLLGDKVEGLAKELGGYGADRIIVCEHPLLKDYTTDGSGCLTLVMNLYQAGNRYTVLTVGYDGAELGRLSSGEQILDISAAGKYLAILTSSSLSIYDQTLQEYDVSDNTAGAASVVMRADGSAILLANGHGTLYVP